MITIHAAERVFVAHRSIGGKLTARKFSRTTPPAQPNAVLAVHGAGRSRSAPIPKHGAITTYLCICNAKEHRGDENTQTISPHRYQHMCSHFLAEQSIDGAGQHFRGVHVLNE